MVAGGQQFSLPLHTAAFHLGDLDTANAADTHRLEVLLMAEHRDRIAGGIVGIGPGGGVVDRGGAGTRPPLGIAKNLALGVGERNGLGNGHLAAVHLDRDLLLEVGRRDLVHPDELAVDVAGEEPVLVGAHEPVLKMIDHDRVCAALDCCLGCCAHVMPFEGDAACRPERARAPTRAAWPPPCPARKCLSSPSPASAH